MRIEKIPRKEFKSRYGPSRLGDHSVSGEGEHVVTVPEGASTKTLMHEIAHAELGHSWDKPITYNEAARRELAADSWVYEKLGKDPTLEEIIIDFGGMVEDLLRDGYSVNSVFNWVKKEIKGFGYELDREDWSGVWWFIRRIEDRIKGRG